MKYKPIQCVSNLAASITCSASKHTYYTIRFLVDRERVADAYQAYAYFRWLDDLLDEGGLDPAARMALADRQRSLMNACFQNVWSRQTSTEERMLVDLIWRNQEKNNGLEAYIRNVMAVMVFDAHRRGQLVGKHELDEYTHCLAVAVTEALHYFIGNGCHTPETETRYLAATGAHITHMLRDSLNDSAAGYFNIPIEYLNEHSLVPDDVSHRAHRAWVESRVRLARSCFDAGKAYLAQVQSWRCRMAGYAYITRFSRILDAIQQEGYLLRSEYSEMNSLESGIKSMLTAFSSAQRVHRPEAPSSAALTERR